MGLVRTFLSAVVIGVAAAPGFSTLGQAESSKQHGVQSGDIQLEGTEQRSLSTSERGKQELQSWLTSMEKSYASGATRDPIDLGDAAVTYLVRLYFFCSSRTANCPYILDTVLESDVVSSKNERTIACSNMSRFWKGWLAGDFDQRIRYDIPASLAERLDAFNSEERPRYVRCKDAVAEILEDKSNFESRYAADGVAQVSLARTQSLLKELWDKNVDILASTAAEGAAAEPEAKDPKKR